MSSRIHILCEAVAFVVVMVYFQIRVHQLNNQIRDIRRIVAEQQTVLQKHEDFIANYILNHNVPYAVLNKTNTTTAAIPSRGSLDTMRDSVPVVLTEREDDVISITESDLDKELSEELQELIEEEENKNENDPPSEDSSGNHHES